MFPKKITAVITIGLLSNGFQKGKFKKSKTFGPKL